MTFDILIQGGTVIDGSESAESMRADVGVTGDTIAAVGDLSAAGAARVIDATGKVVCPGFIDMHTHSDFTTLATPTADSKIRSGVTTEVIGQCGASAFPLRGETFKRRAASYLKSDGLDVTWHDVDGYLAEAETRGCSVNRIPMVGHNTIRGSVMGYVDRAPTPDELKAMVREVEIALEAGAFGLSTGLVYPPGCYATTDEVVALCRPVADAEGVYASHIRSEGDDLEEAVNEVLAIHDRAGVPVHISHLKVSRQHNWHKIDWLRERLFAAIDAGADLTADRYPYTAASTGLDSLLPDWVYEGTEQDMVDRLSDGDTRDRIREETRVHLTDADWESAVVSSCAESKNRRYEGRRLVDIAREWSMDPFDALCELLIADGGRTQGVFFRMKEENLREILSWPFVMIGSDGSSRSADDAMTSGKPHPRSYGTSTRVLARYVRENPVMSIENAVWKLSGFPSQRLGLANRGRIAHTMKADIVIFDPLAVADEATYEEPHRYSVGIDHVLVAGVPAITDGRHTGALAGRVLKRG